MTTTATQVNTDLHIVKIELYDADVMEALVRDTASFSKKDLFLLSRYKKARRHGNQVEVSYHYGKGCEKVQLGRLYAKDGMGLQAFPFDMRNPLLEKHYWDVDMENAHYHLLAKLADDWGLKTEGIREYINNREEALARVSSNRSIAKTCFLKIAYGGNIKLYNEAYNDDGLPADADLTLVRKVEKEMGSIVDMCWTKFEQYHSLVKKKPNPRFSLFALILQTEERKCLLAMDEFLKMNGRQVDIYIHDGAEVRKKADETAFPVELLRGAEKHILEVVGYEVHLAVKPFKHSFVLPERPLFVDVPPSVIVDDAFAAKTFARLMGERLICDGGCVWVFEDGLWGRDLAQLKRVVTTCGKDLVFKQGEAPLANYSGCVKKTACLLEKLPDVLERRDGYFAERVHTDIGKLLFPNGIYDFKTGVFTMEFDPAIVFTGRMPRPFPAKNQALVDEIRRISFTEAFADEGNRNALLHSLMRGVIGDVLRKKFIIGTGWGNSGKGMTATLAHTALGMLCSDFNGNCLLYKSSQGESAREYGWLMANVRSRIAIGSEVMMKNDKQAAIDGNLIKTIASGVDPIKMRGLYKEEGSFVNKSTFFMFAQDIPAITPAEKTTLDRLIAAEWSYSYVDDPTLSYEKRKDPELALKYARADYGDAFFWLMVEEYEAWRLTGFAEPKTDEVVTAGRNQFVEVVDYEGILRENGFVRGDAEDWVAFSSLYTFFPGTSKTLLGRQLAGLGFANQIRKVDGKAVAVRCGLRRV